MSTANSTTSHPLQPGMLVRRIGTCSLANCGEVTKVSGIMATVHFCGGPTREIRAAAFCQLMVGMPLHRQAGVAMIRGD